MKTRFAEKTPGVAAVPPSGPRSAGEALRRGREALGLDLADVAAAVRIKRAYLAALEAGRPEELPGRIYAVGFLRAYADHLGLDTGEIVRRFKAGSPTLDAKPDLSFPMPRGERSVPGKGTVLVALILTLCGYATWYYLSSGERLRPERVAEVPASLLATAQRPVEPAARPTEALAGPSLAAPAPEMPAQPDAASAVSGPAGVAAAAPGAPALPAAGAPVAAPDDAARAAGIASASSPPQNSVGTGDGPARIIIRATADSWIQLRDANQSVLYTHVLKAGASCRVPDRPGVSMRTGNAGGLQIMVDGKPAPSIGRVGMVRRNVALDPQALIAGTAVRQ